MAKLDDRTEPMSADETLSTANENQALCQSLSDPETQILLLIAAGKQDAEIAVAIEMDQAAVKEHVKSILRKAMASVSSARRSRRIELRPSEFPSDMVSPFTA
ncbi:hypothetical protein ILT44_08285 [Microvirga sp. BT689]|uniref:LuxR C-terminal-related transcriptional regulator n=1 Tax=Microvirga arvi TaxID=2778731 RepID=UPI00194E391A|nr:LuxR C-terminal-related transcriptional regulator [Microvirga arvi]MBM6580175.1 hypothetical protein [Microvirga arvi]